MNFELLSRCSRVDGNVSVVVGDVLGVGIEDGPGVGVGLRGAAPGVLRPLIRESRICLHAVIDDLFWEPELVRHSVLRGRSDRDHDAVLCKRNFEGGVQRCDFALRVAYGFDFQVEVMLVVLVGVEA